MASAAETSDRSFALPAAAAYLVYSDGLTELVPDVQAMAASAKDSLARETAVWVLARMEARGATS